MAPLWPYPTWVAHRGAGKLAPENTLAAFRLGFAHGYRMFECDVKVSSDDIAYLMHDGTLDRTTSGHGSPLELPWATLAQLDAGTWHSVPFAGEPIPTLANIASFVQKNACLINLEIKPVPGAEAHTGAEVARQARALWRGAGSPPLLSSFSELALAAAKEAAPELPRTLLLTNELPDDWPERAARLGCAALAPHYSAVNAAVIARCQALGLRTVVYTVNDAAIAQALVTAGVDAIITDEVAKISPL
jgi:glycerophosphoryl diester phosphodiesterase